MFRCPQYKKLTWLEPAIQSETSSWSAVNLKKKQLTLISSKLEPTILSPDTGQWIPYFHRCQLIITWMSNIKDVCCKLTSWSIWPLCWAQKPEPVILITLVYMEWWKYVRTDLWSMTSYQKPKFLALMGYHIFLTMELSAHAKA